MRSLAILFVLTAGVFAAAEDSKEDAVKKELQQLEGTWVRMSIEVNGEKKSDAEAKSQRLTITGEKYTLKIGDQTRQGTLKVDPTKKPKTIDIIASEGPNKGKTLQGIYELDGDTLKYCVAPPGSERPTEFVSKPGSGYGLYVNKREK
jgi:uncharacterized protein (TIGR03067 family)